MTTVLRQATCVLINGGAVLIEGPPGCGKSSLALALIDRGAVLVGDDGVALELRGAQLWASPPPRISGLMEIRNVGLVELPVGEGPVCLLLRLDHAAPRFVDHAVVEQVCGVDVPMIALFPDTPALHLRAEWAVRKYAPRP
jgi:serine kinase of HPr protein (carbohydrate metabolism regulator)